MEDTEAFGADSGVGSTIALLEARLPGVRERRRQLEGELAAVVAQENAMVSVLQGLETLADTLPAGGSATVEPAEVVEPAATEAEQATAKDEPATTQDEPDAAPAPAEPAGSADVPVAGEAEPPTIPTQTARRRTGTTPARKPTAKRAPARKAAAKTTGGRTTRPRNTATASAPATVAPEQDIAAEPVLTEKTAARGAAKKAAAKKAAATKTAVTKAAVTKAAATKSAATKSEVRKTTAKKEVTKPAADAAPAPDAEPQTVSAPADESGRRRRTDAGSVLAVLTGTSDSLRARQVADLLGLDGTDTDVNAVRTMLERLTKSGTVQRTGRGLYTAVSG
ncbi:hypothetical protein SAMN05216371_0363 [Streptomyces sp. TLI_053]|uniref:hypothetical protein n=1 Tax=Streptomyces sp. TLI_053 TaxID=1855352 RepID=UPI00087BF212|nr:hypothetical protein [Streptomyces sp. TLI_053]SDS66079.1 hypothetical protein SAMN05216371_0363 [Streptomyces sp. TLI_053]